jgi:hypothetical protein
LRSAAIRSAGELDLWLKERFYDLTVSSSFYVIVENLHRMLGKDRDRIERLVATNRIEDYLQSVREKFTDYRELVLVNRIGDPLVTSSPEDPLVNLLPPTPAVYTSFRNQPVVGLGKTLPVRHH